MRDLIKMAGVVQDYIARALQPVAERLSALESRQLEPGPQGEKGADGSHGKDGAPGQAGERGPQGEKGADGSHGKDGATGPAGERGPQGEKGADGVNGKDGAPGQAGERGPQGEKGLDGASVTVDQVMPLLEAGVAKWMLEWERRAQDTLAKAVERMPSAKDGAPGRDGKDGQDGRDGLSLDDIAVTFEGRTLTLSLAAGDRIVTRAVKLPALPDYKGVYKRQAYEAGDMVTYGGSMWMAKSDTTEPPPGPAWQLVVKGGK